jgi:hypothetical protein
MIALAGGVVIIGLPVIALVMVLKAVDIVQRRRADVIARQIAVTDAIHAEFGAVVAPVVRRAGRGWRVTLPMDARHPGMARIVELAACALGPTAAVGMRSRRSFDGRAEPVIEVAVVAPWRSAPRRPVAQNKERIASAMSA